MRKLQGVIAGPIWLLCISIFWSCASDKIALQVANSLPRSELADYDDSFDRFREDLWEKVAAVFSDEQLENIRLAHLTVENGRLRIDTNTDGFSKGGLIARYSFRGDFDIQIDCRIHFLSGRRKMDQNLGCGIREQGQTRRDTRFFPIGLLKRGHKNQAFLFSGYHVEGRFHRCYVQPIDDFQGTLRIIRIDGQIHTYCRGMGTQSWKKMCSLESTGNDAMFGFALQNFVRKRDSIAPDAPITAWFDNYKINAAQQIIESEI
jgi:hypothetical protein